ncbi:reverse transcriptase domain-containing protein [Tanacetum coccineum]
MLERLAGHEYYCFLDGFSGYFQLPIAFEDQEKTTFTCPYGTFAYKRMLFGLCNASTTFQRCMTAIFPELIEDSMEVFMDDFSVFGIVLGHKVSMSGIKVDKAKIEAITKLLYPTNVKAIRSFLGHAGFYRRFIKDFSQVARPMTHLLVKDAPFNFSEECIYAFDKLKHEVTHTPIMIKPNWSFPFEIMCDASDYAVGAMLGQRIDKHFQPIHYASKMMNEAQENYTTTKEELLAVERILKKKAKNDQTKHGMEKTKSIRIQKFNIEIHDKKGAENLAADLLSLLENPDLGKLTKAEIRDLFPKERLMAISDKNNEPSNETMAETMEQYMSKTRADYGSGIARPKIDDKDSYIDIPRQYLYSRATKGTLHKIEQRSKPFIPPNQVVMSANDDFSLHDDEELSLHDDASLNGSVPASNKGDAPAKPPQIITTNTLSNIKLPVLQKDDYDTWAMEMEHYLEVLPPTIPEEQVADEKERKARTLLLMAVPKDHLRRFHGMDEAKEI